MGVAPQPGRNAWADAGRDDDWDSRGYSPPVRSVCLTSGPVTSPGGVPSRLLGCRDAQHLLEWRMLDVKLLGTSASLAVCQLTPGQSVYCAAGRFRWGTPNVTVETRLSPPSDQPQAPQELLSAALQVGKRALAGQGLAVEYYSVAEGSGLVGFAGSRAGEIRALVLPPDKGWYARPDAFVAAEASVVRDTAFHRRRSGRGENGRLAMDRFTGPGTLLLSGCGALIELDPAKYGGLIHCDPGCLVGCSDGVSWRVDPAPETGGRSTVIAMLTGAARELVTVEGAGTVLLQSALGGIGGRPPGGHRSTGTHASGGPLAGDID